MVRTGDNLRIFLFWMHLTVGVTAMTALFIMSVTGVLLTYERQMVDWYETRDFRAPPPSPDAARLQPGEILAAVRAVEPDTVPSSITLRADPTAPAMVSIERRRIFVNSYTGHVWGEAGEGLRPFFRSVTDWHRWLGAGGEGRSLGGMIAAASNLATLFIIVSGFYLWWPRNWSWQAVRNRTWFRRGLSGKARNFNWHNVIGFWCSVPLFIIVFGGVIFSYSWANRLLYRSFGEEPPVRSGRSVGPRNSSKAAAASGQATERGRHGRGRSDTAPVDNNDDDFHVDLGRVNELWARAEQQVEGWQTIRVRLPTGPDAPLAFVIDQGTGGQPQKQSTLTLDMKTGAVVDWVPFAGLNPGRQVRRFLRFAHTGEAWGLPGQTIAGIVSVAGCFMVWTGLTLVWRRFLSGTGVNLTVD